MKLENRTIFVSGANRGIGKALVEELLRHQVKKVFAAARNVEELPDFSDQRVVAVRLDLTRQEQIDSATMLASDVDILINNAGVLSFAGVIAGDIEALERDMAVNYFGTLRLTRAFIPSIEKRRGEIVNIASVVGLASIAGIGGYSASKAALFSATQSMRAELKEKQISVIGVFPGPIDTDMAKDFEIDKASPEETARNIVNGIQNADEDIFPDPMSRQVLELWSKDPKGLERQFATML